MKIALSSYTAMGAWFVLRLMAEGHKVDYFLSDSKYEDVLAGLIPKPRILNLDHRRHLLGYGYNSYKGYDLSLFDLTGRAKQADASRQECPTLGDGTLEHLLEDDREFGIKSMEECGINVPPYTRFNTASEAKPFIRKEGKRYVFKPFTSGGTTQDTATTYVAKDANDLIEYIDTLWQAAKQAPFILQEFIAGTEIGTEAFFNGKDFFLISGTLEEKKFMNDNKGPNTGCSGNMIVALTEEKKIFKEGLGKAREFLEQMGFRGIIDLNTIATADKIYGLEWTPRFGYLCCPTIATMYGSGYADLLTDIASGVNPQIKWQDTYGMATTFTIPPYPTEIRMPKAKNVPIEGVDIRDINQLCHTYLFDAMVDGKKLITSGNYGYVGAVIGTGDCPDAANNEMEKWLDKVSVPNMQCRTDIYKSSMERYNQLREWGWI